MIGLYKPQRLKVTYSAPKTYLGLWGLRLRGLGRSGFPESCCLLPLLPFLASADEAIIGDDLDSPKGP